MMRSVLTSQLCLTEFQRDISLINLLCVVIKNYDYIMSKQILKNIFFSYIHLER